MENKKYAVSGHATYAVEKYSLCRHPFVVGLSSDDIEMAERFYDKMYAVKPTEGSYKVDGDKLKTRIMTGALGEIACGKALGCQIFDETVGPSSDYDHPDVLGHNVGIKTVEFGKLPVVPIKGRNKYPQIICVLVNNNTVVVCGVATPSVLDEYQSTAMILSDDLRRRNVKAGFYGFDKLIPLDEFFNPPPPATYAIASWKPKIIDCRKKMAA